MHPTTLRPSTSSSELDAAWESDEVSRQEKESSYIGVLPRLEDDAPVHSASRRHLALATAIHELEEECARFTSYDVSARAAQLALRKRVGSLALVRNALETAVDIAAQDRALEGPIAPYLAGVYLWLDGVTEALLTLARQLNAVLPDWSAFRETLGAVSWLYDMTLAEQARIEGSEVYSGTALGEALDGLFVDVVLFKVTLAEPLG